MKKTLIRITAGLCAVIMLSACPLAALAEDVEGPIEGSQHVKGSVILNKGETAVSAGEKDTITIDGSVTANLGSTAIDAKKDSQVEVGENVSLDYNTNDKNKNVGNGVYADHSDVTVEGTVTVNFKHTGDTSKTQINGVSSGTGNVNVGSVTVDVSSSDKVYMIATGVESLNNSKNTVNGDVSLIADEKGGQYLWARGIYTKEGSETAVDGNVNVSANGANSTSIAYGVYSGKSSKVTVDGDVILDTGFNGNGSSTGVNIAKDSYFEAGGSVHVHGDEDERAVGINIGDSNASAIVAGDVIAEGSDKSYGVFFIPGYTNDSVVVEGTLSGDTAAIGLNGSKESDAVCIVGTLEEGTAGYAVVIKGDWTPKDGEADKARAETFLKNNVNYIVNSTNIKGKSYKITGARKMKGFNTAREDETFVVKGVKDLKAGEYAEVVMLKKGVYAVTVNRGGNLFLEGEIYRNSAFTAALVIWTGEGDAVTVFTCNNKEMMPEDIGSIVVTLDGEVLEAGQYTLTEEDGLLTVVLSADLLSSLRTGNHRLALVVNGASYPSDLYIA